MAGSLRILGLDIEGLAGWRTQTKRNSGLYRALDARYGVVHTFTPTLPVWQTRAIQLAHFVPERERWRKRSGLSPASWRARTRVAEGELRRWDGRFDVIFQIYCVLSPGRLSARRPFSLYLDATGALTRREYPPAFPATERAFASWMALERETYARAGALFPTSDWVRRSLIEDYGVDPARILVADAGSNVVGEPLEGRRWDRRVALFVGLDWERKGGPQLLRAWERVRAELPDAELWVAGTRRPYGRQGENGIRWYGRLSGEEVGELYRQASVFVLPSLFDPFPHVLREAMGFGLPCITTTSGGIPEIVQDGVDSVVIAPGDASALADALVSLLGDPARAQSLGRAGHARVQAAVNWETVVERIGPRLEALAARSDPPAGG